jgi:hypothetical protein
MNDEQWPEPYIPPADTGAVDSIGAALAKAQSSMSNPTFACRSRDCAYARPRDAGQPRWLHHGPDSRQRTANETGLRRAIKYLKRRGSSQ